MDTKKIEEELYKRLMERSKISGRSYDKSEVIKKRFQEKSCKI